MSHQTNRKGKEKIQYVNVLIYTTCNMGTSPYMKIILYCAFYFFLGGDIMANNKYLIYCTKEQEIEFLLSLQLIEKKPLTTLYSVSNHIDKHYEYLEIPKKDGTKRKLLVPDYLLKTIQKNILHHILYGINISTYVTSYRKGENMVSNARPHLKQPMILKLDIKDFFNHITFEQVKKNVFKEEYFPEAISTLLTVLCCYHGKLPQGAPTSPMISNIILKEFDEIVGTWCKERNIVYTRYSDDLTFSGTFEKQEIIMLVKQQLNQFGFRLNTKKTRLLTSQNRQIVTGIVVNEHLQVPRKYRKELRKTIYYCQKFGVKKHLENKQIEIEEKEYIQSLKGKILFVLQVNPNDKEFKQYLKWISLK